MQKFTPGPWHIDPRASTRIVDDADTTIASAGRASRSEEEAQANACFIAAAPEMYEALKSAALSIADFMTTINYPELSGAGSILADVRDAIAKAEGR